MKIIEIAEGVITVEMQPEDALFIGRAFERMLDAPFSGDEPERLYQLYRATFEGLAVAAHAQYSVVGDAELATTALSALKAMPQRTVKR